MSSQLMIDGSGKPMNTIKAEEVEKWFRLNPLEVRLHQKKYAEVEPIGWLKTVQGRHPSSLVVQSIPHCCGVIELFGIDYGWGPREVVAGALERYAFCGYNYYLNGDSLTCNKLCLDDVELRMHPYFLFESNGRQGGDHGAPIKKLIDDNKLGKCETWGSHRNPSGSPHLSLYVWMPDHKALKAWYINERKAMDKKPDIAAIDKAVKETVNTGNKLRSLEQLGAAMDLQAADLTAPEVIRRVA